MGQWENCVRGVKSASRTSQNYTMRMAMPHQKGNALEAAVASIERHILDISPNLREKPFFFESKKIINAGGVHHEIDILVTIDLGTGYRSVFIFECKNWEESVGKNEIIVFAEKIDVTQAQYGYFVAKSFTKDAEAQAATNPRIKLLRVAEHDPSDVPVPFGFHILFITAEHAEATFYVRGRPHTQFDFVDLGMVATKLQGNIIDLRHYLIKWAEDTSQRDALSFRSERAIEGDYVRETESERVFSPGELMLDDYDIERAKTLIRYKASVVRSAVVSCFEVQSRGRVVSLAPVQIPSGPQMQIKMIWH
jgi:Restriction endonuclease